MDVTLNKDNNITTGKIYSVRAAEDMRQAAQAEELSPRQGHNSCDVTEHQALPNSISNAVWPRGLHDALACLGAGSD
jgi:hypothetical protein